MVFKKRQENLLVWEDLLIAHDFCPQMVIIAANSKVNQLQRSIQLHEFGDSIKSDDRIRLRMNEALMALLLRLDSVPNVDPTLRDARKKVSR